MTHKHLLLALTVILWFYRANEPTIADFTTNAIDAEFTTIATANAAVNGYAITIITAAQSELTHHNLV